MNGFDTGSVGFKLLQVFAPDHGTAYTVLLAPFIDALQRRQLGVARGDDDFTTDLVLDAFGGAKRLHSLFAGTAVEGFERTRLIVNAGVQHSRVMPRLMLGQLCFLFKHDDATLGKPLGQVVSRREPHDSATDDGHVSLLHTLSPQPPIGVSDSPRHSI